MGFRRAFAIGSLIGAPSGVIYAVATDDWILPVVMAALFVGLVALEGLFALARRQLRREGNGSRSGENAGQLGEDR
jgi:hypothetical protein